MSHDIPILSLSDRRQWEDVEASHAMPSQCWRFAAALRMSGFEPKLAVVDAGGSRMLLPFVEQRWQGLTDITTLPGLSGASIVPASPAPLEHWHEFAVHKGWVAGYIQLSPASYPNVPAEANPVHQTYTFMIDVGEWDSTRTPSRTIRQKIASANRAGAIVSDDRTILGEALRRLYPETLARFGFRPQLSAATLDAWSNDPLNLLLGVALDGVIEAVHLIQVHGGVAELHLAGLSDRGRDLSALLYASEIERLRTRGVARYNLGGGGNPEDGLYRFKTWLGGAPVPLQSIRHVYDRARYESLCASAKVTAGPSWFPAYRSRPRDHAKG